MSDPKLPLNCPRCGVRLMYVTTVDNTHSYLCTVHGEYTLDLDGFLRGGIASVGFATLCQTKMSQRPLIRCVATDQDDEPT